MSDSDSEDDAAKKKIEIGPGESQKRQARIIQEKALEEDPTIFQYDELYDDMTASREEAKKTKTSEVKKSKYVERLLVTADKRKKEYERRVERQVQKEREAEGEKFKDKEVFVTASYRAKLEEIKKAEEEERREEYLESIGDVTKQQDMDGFYRHLYEQKMGSDKPKAKPESEAKEQVSTASSASISKQIKQRSYRRHHSNENEEEEEETKPEGTTSNEEVSIQKVHLQSNLDADSDFEIDSDSEPEKQDENELNEAAVAVAEARDENAGAETLDKENGENEFVKPENRPKDENVEQKPAKPKIDIWKKRTIGEAFDEALRRYYERKQQRCSSWFENWKK